MTGDDATQHCSAGRRDTIVWGDIVSLALVTLAIAIVSGDAGHAAAKAAVGSAFFFLVCWWMGLYRRTYALVPRDEIFPVVAAGIVVLLMSAFLTVIVLPRHDASAAYTAIALGTIACSIVHVRLFDPSEVVRHSTNPAPANPSVAVDAPFSRAIKRCFDLTLTLLLSAPIVCICALIAIVIVCDDGPPVLFIQERVGKDGKVFRIFKFRTMRRDADDKWAVRGDGRVTRCGGPLRRWSLDELPQFWNVIRGEMSLVGPRPEMVSSAAAFTCTIPRYVERSRVKPGVTGWAQVTQPRELRADDIPAVLEADLFYIDNWSTVFDGVIVLKTAAEVLFHRAV